MIVLPEELGQKTLQEMGECVLSAKRVFLYKKLKKGARVYCSHCQRNEIVTEEQYKQIRYSKVCPWCMREYSRIQECNSHELAIDFVEHQNYGYKVFAKFSWRYGIKVNTELVAIFGQKTYVRNIYLAGCGYPVKIKSMYKEWHKERMGKWRETKSPNYYYQMCTLQWYRETKKVIHTKKEYLFNNYGYVIKSNQRKMIADNLFNEDQIQAIVMFNLKNPDDVYKYRAYIKANRYSLRKEEFYNESTLNYLWKNKIELSDYNDYASLCREMKRKLDKPKDFKLWHDRLVALKEIKQNKKYERGIRKQYKKLSIHNMETDSYTISTFRNCAEIIEVSKCLHNCMSRMYLDRFAKGETELWHLDVDGKPFLAIEVNDGKLIQCRADHNENPPKKYSRYVKDWLRNRTELLMA